MDARMMQLAQQMAARQGGGGRKDAYIQQPRGPGGITAMVRSARPLGTPYDGGPQAGGAGWAASGRRPPMGGGMTPLGPPMPGASSGARPDMGSMYQQFLGNPGAAPTPAPPSSPGYGDFSWMGGQNYGAPQPQPMSQPISGARPTGPTVSPLGPPTGMQVPAPGGMPSMAKPIQGGIGGGGQVQPLEDFQWGARPMIRPPGR